MTVVDRVSPAAGQASPAPAPADGRGAPPAAMTRDPREGDLLPEHLVSQIANPEDH